MPSCKAKGNTATNLLLIGVSLAGSAAGKTQRWATQ